MGRPQPFLGGGIATLGAERHADGTRRLVLVGAFGATGGWRDRLVDSALPRPDAGPARGVDAGERNQSCVGRCWRSQYLGQRDLSACFADPSLALFVPLPRSTSITGAAVAGRFWQGGYHWSPLLRALPSPTIVIHGERDFIPP
ncbi:MAG: alpha/beta hydrolase [Gemmatimonadota bacterium]|nr:alpha/beta hydrolase [Gemmatimonadota bacterium]